MPVHVSSKRGNPESYSELMLNKKHASFESMLIISHKKNIIKHFTAFIMQVLHNKLVMKYDVMPYLFCTLLKYFRIFSYKINRRTTPCVAITIHREKIIGR